MLFLIIGIPEEISDNVSARLVRQFRGQSFKSIPVRSSNLFPIESPTAYAKRVAVSLRDEALTAEFTDAHCVLSFWRDAELDLLERIYPGVSIMQFSEIERDWANQKKLREKVNEITKSIHSRIGGISSLMGKISKEVKKTNSSPLLLPTRHFKNEVVWEALRKLSLIDVGEIAEITPIEITKELRKIARFGKNDLNRNVFLDDRNIVFALPGTAKHGGESIENMDLDQHEECCIILAKFRFGHGIPVGFHFDCVNFDKSKISGTFLGCHKQKLVAESRIYLNIYPNNNVRAGSK